MTRIALIIFTLAVSGCFHAEMTDLSEDVHAVSVSPLLAEPEFLVWHPETDLSKFSMSIQAPDGHIWMIDESSYVKKRIRMTGHKGKYTFINPSNWYRGEGSYIMSANSDELVSSSEIHISGDENFVDMKIVIDHELKHMKISSISKTYPSPSDVYISDIKYEYEDQESLLFLLHNESNKDIHGEGLNGQLKGATQHLVGDEWVDLHIEGTCGSGELPEYLSAKSLSYFGEPHYFDSINMKAGKYRVVIEYSHLSRQHPEYDPRHNVVTYQVVKYFDVDQQGTLIIF